MINLVVALKAEARPLIRYYGLHDRHPDTAFPVYQGTGMTLIVSGPGKVAAASATAWLQDAVNREQRSAWLNIGIAGHAAYAVGDGFIANRKINHGGYIFKHCLPLCAISPSSAIIKRGLFDEIGLFDESLPACEDYDLWLRICAVYPVLYTSEALVIKHGGHEDQLSRRYWGMDRFRIQALEKILASGTLNAENHAAAKAILLEKIRIVVQGADKRDNTDLANTYRGKLHNYSQIPTYQAETTP